MINLKCLLILAALVATAGAVGQNSGSLSRFGLLESQSNQDCSVPIAVIDAIAAEFPCVRDHCAPGGTGGGGGGVSVAPTSPVTVPTTLPPTSTAGSIATPPPSAGGGKAHFGTYIPNWFVYRKHYMGIPKINVSGISVLPENGSNDYQFFAVHLKALAPKLTHLYYAFWDLDTNCVIRDIDPDASWYGASTEPTWINVPAGACKGLMNDMMALKSEFPHLKLLMSVGGWTFSRNFSKCVASAENREKIVKSLFFFFNQMDTNFGKSNGIWDGVDYDWEFPEVPDGLYPDHSSDDWDNYVTLINHTRTRAHEQQRSSFIVSTAIGVGNTLKKLVQKPATTKAFCEALDYVNLMEYDLHGKWDRTTGHQANFCLDNRPGDVSQRISVYQTISELAAAGCPYNKMILGIPNYSHAWSNIPPGQHGNGLFSTATSSSMWAGWSTFSDSDSELSPQGILSYWDLKDALAKYSDFKVYSFECNPDEGVRIPVKHVYSATRQAYATYEDPETVSKKSQWAKAKGLKGVFFWDAQNDRHGDILSAAHSGWGNPSVSPASGSRRCFDANRIKYNLDPLTGAEHVKLCQFTNHSLIFGPGQDSCWALKQKAMETCGGAEGQVIGGHRSGEQTCLSLCSPQWGPGDVGPWQNDVIYYACPADTIPEVSGGGSSGGTSSGGTSGGGQDCKGCDACVAVPGNPQGASNEHCSPCARGRQSWWPCNLGTQLCKCG